MTGVAAAAVIVFVLGVPIVLGLGVGLGRRGARAATDRLTRPNRCGLPAETNRSAETAK